jgi:hypothetical protein
MKHGEKMLKQMKIISMITVMFLTSLLKAENSVEIFESKDPSNLVIEITIDRCLTTFKVPKEKFSAFSNNEKAIDDLIIKARKCK